MAEAAELRVPRGGGTAFLVHCLDRDGASELRTETRPRHLDWLKALYAALPYPHRYPNPPSLPHGTRTHPTPYPTVPEPTLPSPTPPSTG